MRLFPFSLFLSTCVPMKIAGELEGERHPRRRTARYTGRTAYFGIGMTRRRDDSSVPGCLVSSHSRKYQKVYDSLLVTRLIRETRRLISRIFNKLKSPCHSYLSDGHVSAGAASIGRRFLRSITRDFRGYLSAFYLQYGYLTSSSLRSSIIVECFVRSCHPPVRTWLTVFDELVYPRAICHSEMIMVFYDTQVFEF